MKICYYVTGHGYGHGIRTAQVLKALPSEVQILLKTTAPEALFREELPNRELTYIASEYDCGCLQRDSVSVEITETLARYREIAAQNNARLPDEIAFLKRERIACVISDIPSFPLRAAAEAGIPGVAVTNFTWHDIYQDYVQSDEDRRLLETIAQEYGRATEALITPLAMPNITALFPNVTHVPIIARHGNSVRRELETQWPSLQGKHAALLYLGTWGLPIDWNALAKLKDWVFFNYELPDNAPQNVISVKNSRWSHADIAASVDCVISKTGYGTVTECIANGVPLIYVPRHDFAEHAALVMGMQPWGGGIQIETDDFLAGRWQESLDATLSASLNHEFYPTDGASVVAEKLMRYCP